MALVSDGFNLVIRLRDSGDNITTRTLEMTAATFAAAETDAAALVAQYNALTDAEIIGYTVSARFVENAPVIPAAGIQIENTAEIVVNIEGSATKKATFNVPAPAVADDGTGTFFFAGTTGPNSNVVDTAYAPLVAWVGNYGTLGDNRLMISDGEHADGISRGFRVHKKSRKG